jgi:uncharacterized protein YcfL
MKKALFVILASMALTACTTYNYPNHHAYVVGTPRPANTVIVKQPTVVRSPNTVVVRQPTVVRTPNTVVVR